MTVSPFSDRGIDFRAAESPEDRADLIGLCAEVYRQEFGGNPIGNPAFDASARLFGAWKDGSAVGTLRCVLDGPLGLPMEAASGTSCDDFRKRGVICEMGRFAVQRQTGVSPMVLMGLVRLSLWGAIEDGVRYLLTFAPKRIWSLYQRMQLEMYGEPFMHPAGELFVLGALDLAASIEQANREVESGIRSSFLHEVLDKKTPAEEASLRGYLARHAAATAA